ncbi:MAG: hypothetical protein WCJ41_19180 [Aestuariivirga sp.]|uniref:hypothetical protein n=1 Tax=Aestuariivirga sp. TaxID=2650926 RepID=UPI003017BC9D
MRQASQYGNNQDEYWSPGEERLRQLVRLRTQRGRVLTAGDEDKLLEEAVTRLDVSLSRARGVLYAEMQNGNIELETDIDDRMQELVKSVAGAKDRLSRHDFERIAVFYASRLKSPVEACRQKVKKIMEDEGISPRRAGFIPSRSWYRRIKSS